MLPILIGVLTLLGIYLSLQNYLQWEDEPVLTTTGITSLTYLTFLTGLTNLTYLTNFTNLNGLTQGFPTCGTRTTGGRQKDFKITNSYIENMFKPKKRPFLHLQYKNNEITTTKQIYLNNNLTYLCINLL